MKHSISFHARLAGLVATTTLLSMTSGHAVAAECTQADIAACLQVCGPARIYDPVWHACFQPCINGRCGG